MKTRHFGKTGADVPVIGQGTWMMEAAPEISEAALRAGLDAGMTHIDTAELYGEGRCEEIAARVIAGRRDQVFLVSKVLPSHGSFEGVVNACERSLKRLRTDHLDVYLLHWREQGLKIEETFHAFEKLIEDGKIRAWGVSNFDVEDLEEAVRLVGDGKIACNQVLYHLNERAVEHRVLPWCSDHGIAVVAYSPFGQGKLPGPETEAGRVLGEAAREAGATPAQAALRFLVREPHVFAIPKASSVEHALDNAKAGGLKLSDELLKKIDKAFPRGQRRTLPCL